MLNLIVKFYFAHYEVMWKAKHKENDDLKKKFFSLIKILCPKTFYNYSHCFRNFEPSAILI